MTRRPTAGQSRGSSGGIGRSTSAAAERVSDDLRLGGGDLLRRRRRTGALTLGAMASMGVVTAYQMGILRHLPEPPIDLFDADRVDASGEAYRYLRTPDATLALVSYATTLALAGMGSARRATELPLVPVALAAKVAADTVSSLYLTAEQVTKHRRLCSWCLTAAVASTAMVPQVLPEARLAWRQLRRRRG